MSGLSLCKHCGWMGGRRAGEGSGGKRLVVRGGRGGKSVAAAPTLVLVNGKSTFRVSSEHSCTELKILCNHYLINLKITPSNLLT